jgi:hypothetical protein
MLRRYLESSVDDPHGEKRPALLWPRQDLTRLAANRTIQTRLLTKTFLEATATLSYPPYTSHEEAS